MKRRLFVPLGWLALTGSIALGGGDPVDRYVELQLQSGRVPGMSIAVVRNGKLEKAKGYGLADIENHVPATERTVYEWASVTKPFTAEAIMLLVQEGGLRLEDRLDRHYTNAPAAWSNVTIRHLLNHTSGIRSHTELPDFLENVRRDYKPDELIGRIRDLPLAFPPGEGWRYSNTGYYLLGLIIEKVSGKSYGDFLADRIFGPLRMESARANHPFELISNRATGYARAGRAANGLRRSEFVSHTQPYSAGGLAGSVLDLAKWDAALSAGRVLPATVHDQMWTATKIKDGRTEPYGCGWQLGDIHGHRFVGHGGLNAGFTCYLLRLLDDKLSVIVLCNGPGNAEAVARGIAGLHIRGLTLDTIEPRPDPDTALSRRLEQCLSQLAESRDSAILTPAFRKSFSRSRRRHDNLVQDLKDKKSFTFIVSESPPSHRPDIARVNSYRLATGTGSRFYTFALTPDDQVASLETQE